MGEAKELGQRWFDAVSAGDAAGAAALLADDLDFQASGAVVSSPEEAVGFVTAYTTGFPDSSFDVSLWVESGDDIAVCEGVWRGTNTGPMATPQGEMPATGKAVAVPFTTVFEARDGKLTAHRAYWDNAGFMMQIGLMPAPEGAA